jgi:hypothetical protein
LKKNQGSFFITRLVLSLSNRTFENNSTHYIMQEFNQKDLQQIKSKGIEIEQIEKQINTFVKGFPYIRLVAPATLTRGMIKLSNEQTSELVRHFDSNINNYNALKFVPASGAASRMFKHLFEFVQNFDGSEKAINEIENQNDFNSVGYFLKNLNSFAFYEDLANEIEASGFKIEELLSSKDYKKIIEFLILDNGLGYGNLPKALLRFHSYNNEHRMAIEEHLVEAANYCTNEDKTAKVHFTISPEHRDKFDAVMNEIVPKFEARFNIRYDIKYSEQKPSTDTIAVDMQNMPFRNNDDTLVFRPGGHGALIENLNELDDDIIFVKNIDNIVPDRLRDETYTYKKAIGGLLMQLQEKSFDYLDLLDGGNLEEDELNEIKAFAADELMIDIPDAFDGYSEIEKIDFLFNKLNRPMRICGMVKNEGEPGGGPFWVKNTEGEISLQVVESSQMNLKDPLQEEIVAKSTHFNPVDLVCSMYNFEGVKFDLREYVDPDTGFISVKSKDGRDLKALELPGLWNGAMADWITVFVETPLITFNPVKTVNDLLRPQHQPKD